MGIELFLTAGSAIMGWLMKASALARKERHEEMLMALKMAGAVDQSADLAAKRVRSNGGVWVRRIIAFAIVAFLGFLVIGGGLLQIPVVVETVKEGGSFLFGLFSSGKSVTYQEVHGMLLTPELRQGFLAVIAFYLGQGAAK
jgi:hypothetical protein